MIYAGLLVLVALVERLVFDLGPNVELVTAATVLSGVYLPVRYRVLVPMVIMVASDLFLGLQAISFFTWTGFLVMGGLPQELRRLSGNPWVLGLGSGVLGVWLFFLWTNLGVWLLDPFGMYPDSLAGLASSYVNALPFLRNQLLSAVLFTGLGVFGVEMIFPKVFARRKFGRLA